MAESQGSPMNLQLQFACTMGGECDREFFCIKPRIPRHNLEPVCPYLVAWAPLAKAVNHQIGPLVKTF